MSLALVFSVDENVIEVKNYKNIEFLGQDLVNIALEASRYVGQLQRHYLILEMAVSSLESRLLFIALFYPYSMLSTHKIKLDKLFGST